MTYALSNLLLLPFEKNMLPPFCYQEARPVLCCNTGHINLDTSQVTIDIIEHYKYSQAQWQGYDVNLIQIDDLKNSYTHALYHAPQQKEYARYLLAHCVSALEENGVMVAMAANDAGGKSLEKWFKELGLTPTSLSKNKCRIVYAYKNVVNQVAIENFISMGQQQDIEIEENNFITQPGIFGWNKIDRGSAILAATLPDEVAGNGADYGCGYGFLTHEILNRPNNIKKIHLIDADYNAVQCARKNLEKFDIDLDYHWMDLTKPQDKFINLDWIVMNPPFHQGKNIENSIGIEFIKRAHMALKKRGVLYIVANAHLPYEKILKDLFSSGDKIAEMDGFKVYHARK